MPGTIESDSKKAGLIPNPKQKEEKKGVDYMFDDLE